MVFLTNLLNYKRHITESDNGYVPYCFFCNAVFSQSTSKICTLIRFTLFSNESDIVKTLSVVLLPYRFTLFSNVCHKRNSHERVLLPYRFTLFSNRRLPFHQVSCVLLPYRFTLFSNALSLPPPECFVLLPYRFTLFSNLKLGIKCTHYTVHGKSMRLFYNICIMIVNKIRTNHYQSQQVFRIQKLLSALSFQC